MKKLSTLIVILAVALNVNAQKIALHSSSGIQHFTGTTAFVDAYNMANSGDTIYLPGGVFTPPSNIEKSLRIYGAGHYPDSTMATSKTIFNSYIYFSSGADGFYLQGVEINGPVYFDYNTSIDNVIIKYCKMTGMDVAGNGSVATSADNLSFINNVVVGDIALENARLAGIFNCVIAGYDIRHSYGNVLENNIFLSNSSQAFVHGDNNVINNNIFVNTGSDYVNGVSNIVNNNIFVTTPSLGTTPTASGNYYPVQQSTIFIDQTGFSFSYDDNYHLQNPGTYLGLDNTEVGIYGGVHAYKEGAVPSNPHIQFKDISPATTSNGLLNIQINAAAQDN